MYFKRYSAINVNREFVVELIPSKADVNQFDVQVEKNFSFNCKGKCFMQSRLNIMFGCSKMHCPAARRIFFKAC